MSHEYGKKNNKLSYLEPQLLCSLACAVEPLLQNTIHWSVIPLGHTSKQDVDLLMWYHLDSVTGLPQKILFLVEQWYSQLYDMSAMLWTSGDSY